MSVSEEITRADDVVDDGRRRRDGSREVCWTVYVPAVSSTKPLDRRDEMFVGQRGIARYFQEIPPGFVMDARFSERVVSQISENVIISGSYVTFRLSRPEGPVDTLFRITLTLVKTADGWKIAQHHASPRVQG